MMVFPGLGGNGDSQTRAAALRQHLAALVGPAERLHRRQRREGLRHQGPVARPRGPAAVLDRRVALGEDDDRHRHPGLHARRPVQRQPRDGDRPRQRDLARVRPLARPARLLLDRQPRRPTARWTLMADGPLAEHRRDRQEGARLARPAGARAGQRRTATNWEDTKKRHRPDRLEARRTARRTRSPAPAVHNGQAYVANLPGRRIIDPAMVPSGTHLWWSGSGNDFDCPPDAGHNLDLALPTIPRRDAEAHADLQVALGHRVGLRLRLRARRPPTAARPTRPIRRPRATRRRRSQNPNNNDCQTTYGNGLTGSSGSYAAGTQTVDRLAGNYRRGDASSTTSTTSRT